ncbi:44022_t:CDS:2 [Gigaspora margarita]|uniref:44022_t:CDS:1 n=1 Tax=Gigaspora margarita TaxID=4874 RepID=A0ABM8W2U2_GIGMA|nr:44022_t:CDS:2 [Gigaspora margarita]
MSNSESLTYQCTRLSLIHGYERSSSYLKDNTLKAGDLICNLSLQELVLYTIIHRHVIFNIKINTHNLVRARVANGAVRFCLDFMMIQIPQ